MNERAEQFEPVLVGVDPAHEADDFGPFCDAVRALCGLDLLQYKRGQMECRIRGLDGAPRDARAGRVRTPAGG